MIMSDLITELRQMRWSVAVVFFVALPFGALLEDGLHEALAGGVVGGLFLVWVSLLWAGMEADHWVGKAALIFAVSWCVVFVGLIVSALVAAAAQFVSEGTLIVLFIVGSTAITTALWEGI